MNIRYLFLALALGTTGLNAHSQISQGGKPLHWAEKDIARFSVSEQSFKALNMEEVNAYDLVADQYKETPYRFGIEIETDLDLLADAEWELMSDGTKVWRMAIACEEATSISFLFDQFNVPKGGKLFVYDWNRSEFLGAFDHRNNQEQQMLAIGLLNSDKIVLEYHQPSELEELADLHISQIVHGYRAILNKFENPERGPFGSSGACNINVNCPEGDPWQVESRSVALIVSGGFAQCTGALVNNTNNDGTPYFLTANHCLGGNVGAWVFYFNHQSVNCVGSSGPTNQSLSGAVVRANNSGSDFALLELNETPPAEFNVQYDGWDNSDDLTVSSAVSIHHPSGDVKKICFENDAPYHQSTGGAQVWWINQWEDGVTEGGSSGSPLFDQNHRIIGQLYGGAAACAGNNNNGQFDYFGRFGVSWNGASSLTRLRDWLDPSNSGVTYIDGYPDGAISYALDAAVIAPEGLDGSTICGAQTTPVIKIRNMGTDNLTSVSVSHVLNGNQGTFTWNGNLAQGEQENVSLPTLNLVDGINTLVVSLSNPNNGLDENLNNNSNSSSFNAFIEETVQYSLVLVLDDYGTETSWEIFNSDNDVIYSGGTYADGINGTEVITELCLVNGCYTLRVDDSFGDGMCCDYGDGSFTMLNQNSVELLSGGVFGGSIEEDFCIDPNNIFENEKPVQFSIFPNPSENVINLNWSNISGNTLLVSIYDMSGRLALSQQVNNSGFTTLELGDLGKGVYQIRLDSENYSANRSVVIR